jgi:hypothetical protein
VRNSKGRLTGVLANAKSKPAHGEPVQCRVKQQIYSSRFAGYSITSRMRPSQNVLTTVFLMRLVRPLTGIVGLTCSRAVPLYLAAGLGIAHAASTVKAAGINWTIAPWQPPERRVSEERRLTEVFDRYERWQTLRASVQTASYAAAGYFAFVVMTNVSRCGRNGQSRD